MKMMREARIQLTKAGIYDPKMMNFLKKVRCKENPSNFECALNDEKHSKHLRIFLKHLYRVKR